MSAIEIKENFYWTGLIDRDIKSVDLIFNPVNGVTYNSYLLKSPGANVLFDAPPFRCFDEFIGNINSVCAVTELKYVIITHVSPDNAASIEKITSLAPQAKLMASANALAFLKDFSGREFDCVSVADGQLLKLEGNKIKFLDVPFAGWPDTIFVHIDKINVLLSGLSFGAYFGGKAGDDGFQDAYREYFQKLLLTYKSYIRYALNRIKPFDINVICPLFGPVLDEDAQKYTGLYEEWSSAALKREKALAVIVYASAYGHTRELAGKITEGVKLETDAEIKTYDIMSSDPSQVLRDMEEADGILPGSPTVNGDALPEIMRLLMQMNSIAHGGKAAGAFGSYVWSGEAPDMLMSRLNMLKMDTVEPALKMKQQGPADFEQALDYGKRFGRKLNEVWKKRSRAVSGKTRWLCTVCGEVFDGALPPDKCPVCNAGKEAFVEYSQGMLTFRDNKKLKTVIIGSGAAAIAAAEAIRARNRRASIDIYTRENIMPYYRPLLTKGLAEKVNSAEYFIKPPHFFEEKKINIHAGSEVSSIDAADKKIVLSDGSSVEFDKLLITAGARCFIPPFQGALLPEVIALREQSDFDSLMKIISGGPKKAVIIGGGLLGLETAYSLFMMKHEVTVLEACPVILPRQLDKDGAAILEASIEENSNVILRKNIFVDEILGTDKVIGVKTRMNEIIPCDLVIISAGIRSNFELAKNAGLDVDRAVTVNEKMLTSHPDIYAAGDCASFNSRIDGVWETAIEQGKVAGANMTGDDVSYKNKIFGATFNAFGTGLFSIGELGTDEKAEYLNVSFKNDLKKIYRKFFFKKRILSGGILLGDLSTTASLLHGVVNGFDVEKAEDCKLL
ncbi:MAG: hypothetical protein A2017_01565 [Lentisphaerae bacterium GWF2_44_16]|nr:MAG: hypothetical protein A2017_01565 [Lentisphaerae bacterium GWF2_44_16]